MAVRVGTIRDIAPGQLRAFSVGRTRVAIANVAGVLHGIDDTCTHMGCSLAAGELSGTTVTCECHGSQFDVTTGDILRGPADEPVGTWVVRVEADDVVVEEP